MRKKTHRVQASAGSGCMRVEDFLATVTTVHEILNK